MPIQNKSYFFQPTVNNERFLSQDEPTEQVFRNFLDSIAFKLEVADTGTETQQGLVETATQLEYDAGTDNNANGWALYVRPSMIIASLNTLEANLQDQINSLNQSVTNIDNSIVNITTTIGENMPIASMIQYPVAAPPNLKWARCEGQPLAVATYNDLFGVIGYTFGGAGANFNLPDLRRKFVAGYDAAGNPEYQTIGSGGGADAVTLTGPQSGTAAHTHNATGDPAGQHNHQASHKDAAGGASDGFPRISDSIEAAPGVGGTITNTVGDHNHAITVDPSADVDAAESHENRPEFVVFPWIMKIEN